MDLLESSQFWSLTIHGFMSHPKTSFKLQQRLRGAEMEALVLIVVVTTQETECLLQSLLLPYILFIRLSHASSSNLTSYYL